jgi:hypothetical protein
MLEKYAGLLALSLFLFWIWKDAGASVDILHGLGNFNSEAMTQLRGGGR